MVALLACALSATGASAATVPVWQSGLVAQAPSGGSDPSLTSVSCTAPGDCSAVGQFIQDSTYDAQGLLVNEDSGHWSPGVQATLPNPLVTGQSVSLSSVSCSSPGNCSAVGTYYDTNYNQQGLLLTETDGQWGPGVEAQLPAGDDGLALNSVSCAGPGDCSAVGYYLDSSDGDDHGLVIKEIGGTWQPAQDASIPIGRDDLSSVSCWSPGNCTAVGYYVDGIGQEGVELTETNGHWGTGLETQPPNNVDPTGVSLPGHGGIDGHAALDSVSCTATGDCSAAGNYYDTNGVLEGMVDDEVGGAWRQAAEVTLPSDASNLQSGFPPPSLGVLNAISCASPGNCAAAGFFATGGGDEALVVSQSSGTWSDGTQVTLPSGYSSIPRAELTSVWCPAAGECVAAGDYETTTSEDFAELFVAQDAGAWQPGVSPALASGSTASVAGQSVSCSAPGDCGAVDAEGNLFNAFALPTPTPPVPASPTLTLRVPRKASLGRPSSATATLSAGANPAGTITFKLFGPEKRPPVGCLAGGRTVGTATASGNGTYRPSRAFVPRRPGRYWWYASYGGDSVNHSAASDCGGSLTATTVARKPLLTVRGIRVRGRKVWVTLACDSERCRTHVSLRTAHLSSGAWSTLSTGQHDQLVMALGVRRRTRAELVITVNGRRIARRAVMLR